MSTKRVILGLSGGVDSSVSAYLLKNKGYDVTGMFFIMSDEGLEAVEDAKKCADFLSIPIIIKDMRNAFNELVIQPFMEEYFNGLTPNPCVKCNPKVKFKELLKYSKENDIDYIATGHYADLVNINGRYTIKTPKAENRDQTYMLYGLSQEILSKIIFPLSGYLKPDVRKLAKEIGLFTAQKPDSQDICFVKNTTHASYIEERLGKSKIGNFISPDNKVLGKNKGIVNYTIGQRKGLGIALGKPCFVKSIDPTTGDVHLAFEGENLINELEVKELNYVLIENLKDCMDVLVKIRSTAKLVKATIHKKDNEEVLVKFKEKQKLPSSGQAIVFYIDDLLVAGGTIK